MTESEIELITDPDMYIFFEKDMTGRFSYISNKYNKAKNMCLKSYDPKQVSKHIIYLDSNNVYDYAMSKFLPTSSLKRIDTKKVRLVIVQKDMNILKIMLKS